MRVKASQLVIKRDENPDVVSTEFPAESAMTDAGEKLRLLKRAVRLFASSADYNCGNCEGTPCDDMRPRYVCPEHRWLKEARAAIRKLNEQQIREAR